MYLTEYLGLRGVGAAALTVPEATLRLTPPCKPTPQPAS